MEILVCVKKVPDTADAEVILRPDGKGIKEDDLAFGINEWDNYAVEEAIRIKEAHGGRVTVVTIGVSDSEDVLRRCLAMGADDAIMIDGGPFAGSDPYGIARGLRGIAAARAYDLVLAGAQAGDDGFGMVGPVLAGYLGWSHATLVTSVSVEDGKVAVTRELEGGLEERLRLALPAVLTVQTGINEPRYVSIMGIRKVRSKEIPVLDLAKVGLAAGSVGENANVLRRIALSVPPAGKEAEMIKGTPAEIARKILDIVRERGGVG
ncbi:MAG: electron transfer flavoprotein subunit beta/FixA family protein [Candidatus Krumholzibacteria bacterium]|nr:electron transfer flavoprotein subunit beta/FixA family protein [Candidatus Krumholzibacteria bacterium]